MRRNLLIAILLALLCTLPLFALDIDALDFHSGILWMIDEPADDEGTGAPDPLLTPVGFGVSIPLDGRISLDPAIYLYGTNYAFQGWDRPRPAQIEQREMYVLSLMLDPAFAFTYDWRENISWGFILSPTMIFRIPTVTAPGEEAAHSEMLNYFIGPGRFIFPQAGLFMDWRVNEKISFRPAVRTYLPVFHIWDGDPLLDQLTVFFNAGFRLKLAD